MTPPPIPATYEGFVAAWDRDGAEYLAEYTSGRRSWVPNLLPEIAVRLDTALDPAHTDPAIPAGDLPVPLCSPVHGAPDGSWLKRANMVGINVRTIGGHWEMVKYLLTVPAAFDSVHLLPIWEPGVVESLYGMSGWSINSEFFSPDLAAAVPHLDTVERQLRAVVNLLHATGRTVGMDVIPHTDRFSEMATAQPHFFEWLRRDDLEIADHRADLHEEVQGLIHGWLVEAGPATDGAAVPATAAALFSPALPEERRLRMMFGEPDDHGGRTRRRIDLLHHLYAAGYEPAPATMGVPFRGLVVDASGDTAVTDEDHQVWRDYLISRPEGMSRVFNPLARYKLYERIDDNARWEIDFDRPRPEVWDYVCAHYADVQRRFGFDFMRGDMSHVQMRPGGTPPVIDRYYDLLGTVKHHIREHNDAPYFGYFAETFLPPRDTFGYGEEMDHLEASSADTTLGDLQSTVVGSDRFVPRFRQYLDWLATRDCAPNFTLMTADKDDPRFDELYAAGNELRMFIALFLPDMPSYVSLGFETRDPHPEPWPNEHYTKLYVFHERDDSSLYPSKARSGPYRWGQNGVLFANLTRLHRFAEEVLPVWGDRPTRWLLPPDARTERKVIAWTQSDDTPDWVFVANLDLDAPARYFAVPRVAGPREGPPLTAAFSTMGEIAATDREVAYNGVHHKVPGLGPGEGRAYRVGA